MSSVLVVDDEAGMRQFYVRALAAGGYYGIEARTAEEALDFLALAPDVSVVVADMNMPGHGGVWLVERMREKHPHVAIVMATANESMSGTVTLQPAVVAYLVKPISAAQLLEAVGSAAASRPPAADPVRASSAVDDWLNSKLTHRRGGDGGGNP